MVFLSKVTINRFFSAIDSDQFESYFIEWVNSISDLSKGQVIAIDGKTIRGAKSHGKKSPIHMVSTWACENNLVLGQVKTAEKTNETSAIPELLNMLNIAGNTITIDAMGTQKEIAKKIIKQDADYILAVKANQPQLLEHIEDEFRFSKQSKTYTSHDLDHEGIETIICSVIKYFQFIEQNSGWMNLKSIIKIESTRTFKNKLHWTLDVAFSEDASRKRVGNTAKNYSILLKIALNLLKNESSKKLSIKSKRLEAGWNEDFLLKILDLKV